MNLWNQEQDKKEVTEGLFLNTVAIRICELKRYDQGDIGPILSALSELHSREVKGVWGRSNKKELSLIEALENRIDMLGTDGIERDPFSPDPEDTYRTVLQAIQDSTSTLQYTHTVNPRSDIFELFEREGSATFGQELSGLIGIAMQNPPNYY